MIGLIIWIGAMLGGVAICLAPLFMNDDACKIRQGTDLTANQEPRTKH